MSSRTISPYGTWKSPVTADLLTSGTVRLGDLAADGEDVYWVEGRPSEGGRFVVVVRTGAGVTRDVTPAGFNVRTRVHEYGGGAFTVHQGTVYFSNFQDGRLHRQLPGADPEPLTPESARRYADLEVDKRRQRILCILEEPGDEEPRNTLASVDLRTGEVTTLVGGNDFYAAPCLSPDASRLAWLTWNHPDMPWDATALWMADVAEDGTLENMHLAAGGKGESVFQPRWSPDGVLTFVSDRTGWWNLYCLGNGELEALCPMEAEFGLPLWVFGMSTYCFVSATDIVCTYTMDGFWNLARLNTRTGRLTPIDTECSFITGLRAGDGFVAFTAGFPSKADAQVRLDLDSGRAEILRRSSEVRLDAGDISVPEPVEFSSQDDRLARAFLYRPRNRSHRGPEDEKPPLLVMIHGGPTAAAPAAFVLKIHYWTTRGFAVLDVNYGGSTGYGRPYREVLYGRWGEVDVDDCAYAARHVVDRGEVDPDRLAITGGSAGGYTVLAALAFRDVFKAGASHYGVSSLEALTEDTHKFESRYLDRLVGPYPACRALYRERSPLLHADRITCPVIFFQGLDDKVVPPDQSERMADALRSRGIPVALVTFEGEQHGFRKAESIRRAYEGELYFYSRIFGFEPADDLEAVEIDNL